MAVVSAAIAAVAAASAMTAATIGTAVVAVSTVIGLAGLATTAVGMITKNPGLLKAGKIMGYVGLAGGLGGGAIGGLGGLESGVGFWEGAKGVYTKTGGHLADAWDEGVGSFFNSDAAGVTEEAIREESLGTGMIQGAGARVNPGETAGLDQKFVGMGIQRTTPVAPSQEMLNATAPMSIDQARAGQSIVDQTLKNMEASQVMAGITPPPAPVLVGANIDPNSIVPPADSLYPKSVNTRLNVSTPSTPSGDPGWNMPDWQKAQLAITGGQAIAGLGSGWMAGLSAEEKLELEKKINDQNQAQVQYLNRNAAYAPLIRFRSQDPTVAAGLINRPRRTA